MRWLDSGGIVLWFPFLARGFVVVDGCGTEKVRGPTGESSSEEKSSRALTTVVNLPQLSQRVVKWLAVFERAEDCAGNIQSCECPCLAIPAQVFVRLFFFSFF